ncbi:MAG: RNA degradosome polyphosphate kinase, partial [Gammaproteobacteria bacterium]
CLRPGVPGVSETVRVRSIVGRFLEHTRAFYFHHGGKRLLYCGSADWMVRNFFRRVEVCFPIEKPALKERILEELDLYLRDNVQAWELRPDGTYERMKPGKGEKPLAAQQALLERLAE